MASYRQQLIDALLSSPAGKFHLAFQDLVKLVSLLPVGSDRCLFQVESSFFAGKMVAHLSSLKIESSVYQDEDGDYINIPLFGLLDGIIPPSSPSPSLPLSSPSPKTEFKTPTEAPKTEVPSVAMRGFRRFDLEFSASSLLDEKIVQITSILEYVGVMKIHAFMHYDHRVSLRFKLPINGNGECAELPAYFTINTRVEPRAVRFYSHCFTLVEAERLKLECESIGFDSHVHVGPDRITVFIQIPMDTENLLPLKAITDPAPVSEWKSYRKFAFIPVGTFTTPQIYAIIGNLHIADAVSVHTIPEAEKVSQITFMLPSKKIHTERVSFLLLKDLPNGFIFTTRFTNEEIAKSVHEELTARGISALFMQTLEDEWSIVGKLHIVV